MSHDIQSYYSRCERECVTVAARSCTNGTSLEPLYFSVFQLFLKLFACKLSIALTACTPLLCVVQAFAIMVRQSQNAVVTRR